MGDKIKHLEMIENIIERMARNSFMLKGWAVTLIVGIFAIVGKQSIDYSLISLIPLIVFWGLDSYYLTLERKYRELYENVRLKKEEDVDFSMKIVNSFGSFVKSAFSISQVLYLAMLVAITILYCVVKFVG